jgi:hypothetical protein
VDAALGKADAIDRRLQDLRERWPTPAWTVATLARAGSVYDCIWNGFERADPVFFTPNQQALLNRLRATPVWMPGATVRQTTQIQNQIDDTEYQVRQKWGEQRDKYIRVLTTKMVSRYVTAALLARYSALEEFTFTRAHQRLPIVAAALGASRMSAILLEVPDPTDVARSPEDRRRIRYVDGAFGP